MAIGSRVGSRGELVGSVIGSSGDDEGMSMQGVTKDATSGIYCPATLAEWNQTMAAAGIGSGSPSVLWLCQEASGNLADSIGSFTGTATNWTYAQTVSGWTRKALTGADASVANAVNTSGSLPSLASASVLGLFYAAATAAPASERQLMDTGTTAGSARVTATPRAKIVVNAGSATGTVDPTGQVRPWVFQHNFTASAQAVYTDQEKIVPTFAALAGQRIRVGAGAVGTPSIQVLYGVWFFNAAAEMSSAQVKALLQVLGWNPLFS